MPIAIARRAGFALLALLAAPLGAFGQDKDKDTKEDVTIPTLDGVELKGSFYKSGKGRNAPVALLLHDYGKDRTKGDWDKLAKDLVKRFDFAVLSFDFRGHGSSTTVDTTAFWTMGHNAPNKLLSGGKNKPNISFKDFRPGYKPYLVNDIAAARRFLDRKNDAGDCNTSSIFVFGAGEGATLGMLWVATEWKRDGMARTIGGAIPKPAGQDIAGGAWLSIKKTPTPNLHFTDWCKVSPDMRDKVPMCFFHGDGDQLSAGDAKYFHETVLKTPANAPKLPKGETFVYPVKGAKLNGIDLYGKDAKADEKLMNYVELLVKKRGQGNVWTMRNVANMQEVLVPISTFGIGTN